MKDNFSTKEQEVRDRLGPLFDKAYKYIDLGNDRRDLIITVLDFYTMTRQGALDFTTEVAEVDKDMGLG